MDERTGAHLPMPKSSPVPRSASLYRTAADVTPVRITPYPKRRRPKRTATPPSEAAQQPEMSYEDFFTNPRTLTGHLPFHPTQATA